MKAVVKLNGQPFCDIPQGATVESMTAQGLIPEGATVEVVYEIKDYHAAVSAHLDAVARGRDFDGAIDAASFATSTHQSWSAEAAVFVAWRDSVWLAVGQALQNPPASPQAFIASLPVIAWP